VENKTEKSIQKVILAPVAKVSFLSPK
jgi:hypothetical protein